MWNLWDGQRAASVNMNDPVLPTCRQVNMETTRTACRPASRQSKRPQLRPSFQKPLIIHEMPPFPVEEALQEGGERCHVAELLDHAPRHLLQELSD